jgi:hypothetical protein
MRLVVADMDQLEHFSFRLKLSRSLPGSTRQSIDLRKNFLAKKMDARVKPAHDELAKRLKLAPMGSSPRMTPERVTQSNRKML